MANLPTIIAGNWKMNGDLLDAVNLAEDVVAGNSSLSSTVQLIVCPSFTALGTVSVIVEETPISLGGQDCSIADKGAHTGDISVTMLKDIGCTHVIVGHSERRTNHGEDNALVKAKATAALNGGLTPIICIGETLAQREAGETIAVVTEQYQNSVPDSNQSIIVAYEPVWAIGTGKVASLEDITEVHNKLRALAGDSTPLLYGGSVKPGNAADILAIANVNGALVGGASLKADDFLNIAKAAPVAVAA